MSEITYTKNMSDFDLPDSDTLHTVKTIYNTSGRTTHEH